MHYIFSTFGSAGDMHPMMGLGLALRRLGHEVTFIVNGYFRELVQRFGFEFVELGSREQFLAGANHPDLWHPRRAFGHIYRSLIEPCVRPQYDALASRYEPGKYRRPNQLPGIRRVDGARQARHADRHRAPATRRVVERFATAEVPWHDRTAVV